MKHKLYDYIYIKFEGKQNYFIMAKKFRTMVTHGWGILILKEHKGSSKEMEMFFILFWLMVTQVNIIKTQ